MIHDIDIYKRKDEQNDDKQKKKSYILIQTFSSNEKKIYTLSNINLRKYRQHEKFQFNLR